MALFPLLAPSKISFSFSTSKVLAPCSQNSLKIAVPTTPAPIITISKTSSLLK